MKKLLSIMLCGILLTSCSSEISEEFQTQPQEVKMQPTKEYQSCKMFICNLDSINAVNLSTTTTRAIVPRDFGRSVADATGKACGGTIGKWVGGTLGSLTGSPVGTIIGSVIGQKCGPYICSTLASSIVNAMIKNNLNINTGDNSLVGSTDIHLDPNKPIKVDSIGLLHNQIMIWTSDSTYVTLKNADVDKSRMYDDIIKYCKDQGYYDEEIANNPNVKKTILQMIDNVANPVLEYERGNISENSIIEKECFLLENSYYASEEDILVFRNVACKIISETSSMDDDSVARYAKNVNTALHETEMPGDLREKIATSAIIAINSSLIWKE